MICLAGNRGALFMTIKARLLVCLSLLAVAMLVCTLSFVALAQFVGRRLR